MIINARKMIDASFVEVPVQRCIKEKGGQIKNGGSPASFGANPHVKSQKDVDARWTKKIIWYTWV